MKKTLESVMREQEGVEPTDEDRATASVLAITAWSLCDGERVDLAERLIAEALTLARQSGSTG